MTSDITSGFAAVATALEHEGQLRERLRLQRDELDVAVRSLETQLSRLHYEVDWSDAVAGARQQLRTIGSGFLELQSLVPEGMFYKYNDLWRQCSIHIVQSCLLIRFFETVHAPGPQFSDNLDQSQANDSVETCTAALVTKDEVLEMLDGEKAPTQPALRLDLEEYLLGLCGGIQELARLAANRVVLGDYATPRKLAFFCNQVYAGFRLLNFRNDSLRRSYDALKYAIQRLDSIPMAPVQHPHRAELLAHSVL
jgi:hypothetical protein